METLSVKQNANNNFKQSVKLFVFKKIFRHCSFYKISNQKCKVQKQKHFIIKNKYFYKLNTLLLLLLLPWQLQLEAKMF